MCEQITGSQDREPAQSGHKRRASRFAQNPVLHVKLDASSVLPAPLYFATSGYWHNGRVRTTFPV